MQMEAFMLYRNICKTILKYIKYYFQRFQYSQYQKTISQYYAPMTYLFIG